jgi:hypothetical protein
MYVTFLPKLGLSPATHKLHTTAVNLTRRDSTDSRFEQRYDVQQCDKSNW